jgi:signal transduction histidine kinase
MAEPLADRVKRRIDQASELHHRLVILGARPVRIRPPAFQDVHEHTAAPLVNVNLELSRRMLASTERKRAEQAVQDSSRQLERAGRRALALARKADAASRAKSLFISRMIYELRTPLHAVMGFSQLLMNDPGLTPRQMEKARTIHRSSGHLLNHFNEILDMSGIEAGTIELRPAPFDLHGLLSDLKQMFRSRARARGFGGGSCL